MFFIFKYVLSLPYYILCNFEDTFARNYTTVHCEMKGNISSVVEFQRFLAKNQWKRFEKLHQRINVRQKLDLILENKVVKKLKLEINGFCKKMVP